MFIDKRNLIVSLCRRERNYDLQVTVFLVNYRVTYLESISARGNAIWSSQSFQRAGLCFMKHPFDFLIYIQQDATLHSLFYLKTALHVSGGTSTHHQERKQLYLQHLVFATPLLLPAAIAPGSSNGVTNTRCCRYSCLRSC